MSKLYPWHQAAWQQLLSYRQQRGLPHALLLSGVPGLAKVAFAERAAKSLLCESLYQHDAANTWLPCGHCFACQLSDIHDHPDYFILKPLDDGKAIKIEQIRELIDVLQQKSHRSGNRVILITPAEAMNTAAANALLKTLEEPGNDCYLWLISNAPTQLPATIRSRCQSLKIAPTFADSTIAWLSQQANIDNTTAISLLQQAEGAPLHALELVNTDNKSLHTQLLDELTLLSAKKTSFITIAQNWQQRGVINTLDQLMIVINQITQQRFKENTILLPQLSMQKLIEYNHFLLQQRKTWIINPNLNAQLFCENIVLQWMRYT